MILLFSTTVSAESKKITILYASIGNGHKAAAEAIKKQTLEINPTLNIEVLDVFDFSPKWVGTSINYFYNLVTQKAPFLYDIHFKVQLNLLARLDSLAHSKNAARFFYAGPLLDHILKSKSEILFSTFNHTTEGLIAFKEKNPNLIIGSTLTDYVSHDYYKTMIKESDITFLPSNNLLDYYKKSGADSNKMKVSTIPVDPKLTSNFDKAQRSQMFKDYGLDPDITTILLISGANGVGKYRKIVRSILQSEYVKSHELQLMVVAGRNKTNYQNIKKLEASLPENVSLTLHPLIPSDQARDYIKMSDLVITKAGGLTSTELAMVSKAAILLDINGGQEKYNCNFFSSCGGVKVTSKQSKVGELMDQILLVEGQLSKMKLAQKSVFGVGENHLQIANWLVDKAYSLEAIDDNSCKSMVN